MTKDLVSLKINKSAHKKLRICATLLEKQVGELASDIIERATDEMLKKAALSGDFDAISLPGRGKSK